MMRRDFPCHPGAEQSPPHHPTFHPTFHVKQWPCRIELLLLIGDTLSVRFTWEFVAVNAERLPLRHERPDHSSPFGRAITPDTDGAGAAVPLNLVQSPRRGRQGDDPLNQRSHGTFHVKRQHDGVTRSIAAFAAAGSWNGVRSQGRAPSVRLSRTRDAPFHVKPIGSTRILENGGQTESHRGDPPTIACRGLPSTGSANQFPATKDPHSSTGRHSRVRPKPPGGPGQDPRETWPGESGNDGPARPTERRAPPYR